MHCLYAGIYLVGLAFVAGYLSCSFVSDDSELDSLESILVLVLMSIFWPLVVLVVLGLIVKDGLTKNQTLEG